MTFPNAQKGISKFFIGEVLGLFGALIMGVSIFFAKPVVVSDQIDFTATGSEITVVAILLATGGLLAFIAYILQLIGVVNASRDEEAFKGALYLIFFNILFSIAGGVLAYLFPDNAFLSGLGTVVTNLVEILITFLIIGGIGSLGAKINDVELQEKAAKLLGIIMTVIVLRFIANVVLLFFKESIAEVIVTILGIMVLILTIIEYIMYLSLLAKAKNTLARK